MWIRHTNCNTLRLDALGRVWWDVDLHSCGLIIPIATDYDWMPWGGFGWIRICIHVHESAQLQKLRMDAVGRVWWD